MPAGGARDQSRSLCAKPSPKGRPFHLSVGPDHDVLDEFTSALNTVARSAVDLYGLLGDVRGKLRAAGRGELAGSEDLEPVRLHPTLWELKWHFRKQGEFRLYHAEPNADPHLVGLRFHQKDTSREDVIKERQEAEMDTAAGRFREHEASRWGHRPGLCRYCVDPE